MKQSTINSSKSSASQELLCLSLPYLKSCEQLSLKQDQILKNSLNPNFLPLSLVEESLLKDSIKSSK